MTRKLIAENWRLERARYTLAGNHCEGCDVYHFPKKQLCLKCKNDENLVEHVFSGLGDLVEWTQIYEPARGFELISPYYYAIVELEEGIRITTQLTSIPEGKELFQGLKVKMVFRKLFQDGDEGLVTYGFKAKPIFD